MLKNNGILFVTGGISGSVLDTVTLIKRTPPSNLPVKILPPLFLSLSLVVVGSKLISPVEEFISVYLNPPVVLVYLSSIEYSTIKFEPLGQIAV